MGFLKEIFKSVSISEAKNFTPEPLPTTLPSDHALHKEDFKVVGMTYHKQAFARLQVANPEWRTSKKKIMESDLVRKYIFHYDYVNKPVKLETDKTNQHGIDRTMVFIAGEHIGYLSEDDDRHVAEILKYGSVKYITARITGGDYRIVYPDGTEQKDADPLRVTVRIAYSV